MNENDSGQNGTDKMVYRQNDKPTKWYWTKCVDKMVRPYIMEKW